MLTFKLPIEAFFDLIECHGQGLELLFEALEVLMILFAIDRIN